MNEKTGFIEVVGGFITGHGDGCTDGFGNGCGDGAGVED